jgi:hypothetical protein
MVPVRTLVFSCMTAGLTATAAVGQDVNYTSIEATSDKPVQLSYHASAHKNCTPAPLPTIRVIEAPKSGTLTVRGAVLKTNKVAGCPGLKTPAQVVFYLAHAGYVGPDHVKCRTQELPHRGEPMMAIRRGLGSRDFIEHMNPIEHCGALE